MQIKPDFQTVAPPQLMFPHPKPPASGTAIEVAPGILWARLALPFLLDHVNIYFIDDGDGWAVIDTGLGDEATKLAWPRLLDGPLRNRPLTRIIATHFHPDHVGAAGFLLKQFDVPLYMAATEYLQSLNIHLDPGALEAAHYRRFYTEHGLDEATTQRVVTSGHAYLKLTSGLPPTYHRVVGGDVLRIGNREFEVLTGAGHSPEEIMLFNRAEKLFFAADQVLAKISPNVSVIAVDPEGDPLGYYLRSLNALRETFPTTYWCCRDTICRSTGCTPGSPNCSTTIRDAAIAYCRLVAPRRSRQPSWYRRCSRASSIRIRWALRSAKYWHTSTTCCGRAR